MSSEGFQSHGFFVPFVNTLFYVNDFFIPGVADPGKEIIVFPISNRIQKYVGITDLKLHSGKKGEYKNRDGEVFFNFEDVPKFDVY